MLTLGDVRLEVIPIASLEGQIEHLPAGSVVPVTCSPTKGIEATLQACARLRERGHRPVAHIAARMTRGQGEVRQLAVRLAELGVPDIFVVAGDVEERVGPFDGGLALLEELASFDHGIASIGIPAYPETHPMLAEDALFAALDSKQRYAAYMVSQIRFDPARTLEWLRAVRMRGVALPLYVGIAGPMKMRRLMATSLRIGVGASARFLSKQGELATRLISGYRPDHLVEALEPYVGDRDHGIAGFHINTFNQVDATVDWLRSTMDGRADPILGAPWESAMRV